MKKKRFVLFFLIFIIVIALIFFLNKNTPIPRKHVSETKCFAAQSEWEIYPLIINEQDAYSSFTSIIESDIIKWDEVTHQFLKWNKNTNRWEPVFISTIETTIITPGPPPSYIPEPPPGTPNLSPMTPEESEEYAKQQQLVDLDASLVVRNTVPMSEFHKIIWCPESRFSLSSLKSVGFDAIGFSSDICGSDKIIKTTYWSGVIHTIELVKEGEEITKVCHENEYRILPDALYIGYFIDVDGRKVQAVFEAKDGKQPNIPEAGEGVFYITLYFLHIDKEYDPANSCFNQV